MAAPTRVSSSATAFNTSTTPKTVAGVSVQAGDLVVVSAGSENGNSTAADPTSTGYTFTLAGTAGSGGLECEANTWYAIAPSAATISVTNTVSGGGQWGMEVTVWRNHGGVGNVFAGDSNTTTSAPSGALTTTGANSAVDCVVADWNASATSPTYRNLGDTPVQDAGAVSGGAYSIYAWHNPDAGAAGAKTIGLTAPTMRWAMVGLEILGATASGITGAVAASTPALTVGPPTASISGTVSVPVYTGAVAASTPVITAGAPTAAISGTVTDPTWTGTPVASTPTVTVGPPSSSIAGTVTAPGFNGSVSASTPGLTAGPPTAAISGTVAPPTYSGTPTASTPTLTVGPPTASISGTVAPPSGGGTLSATLPVITVGPPTVSIAGTVTDPTWTGNLTASLPTITVGPPGVSASGTVTAPTWTGSLATSTPSVTVGPPTSAISGTVIAPGQGSLVASLPTIVIGPPTTSISGAVTDPTWTGTLTASAPAITVGPPQLAMSGTVTAPTRTGSLAASLPTITVGPLTTFISDTPIPTVLESIGTHREHSHLGTIGGGHLGTHRETAT